LLAGNRQATAVVRVSAVDDDGQGHFSILPGSVAKNRHLLKRIGAEGPARRPRVDKDASGGQRGCGAALGW
nr:hypothetical protein [Acidimicrobiia bacterium]